MAEYVVELTDDEKARFNAALPGRTLTCVKKTEEGTWEKSSPKPKGKTYQMVLTESELSTVKSYLPEKEITTVE